MSSTENNVTILPKLEEEKPKVRIITTNSEKWDDTIRHELSEFEVYFLEDVKMQFFKIGFESPLDFFTNVMKVYAVIANIKFKQKNYLRDRDVEVLAFYMTFGFSKETKNLILETFKINAKNLNQLNSELTRKGFLIRDPYNANKRYISQELQMLQNLFTEANQRGAALNFRFHKVRGGTIENGQ